MKCPICKIVLSESHDVKEIVMCKGNCKHYFHKSCTDFKDLRSTRGVQTSVWKCNDCRSLKNTPSTSEESTITSDLIEVKQVIASINDTLNKVLSEVTIIKNNQLELQKSVDFCCNKVDDFQLKLNSMDDKIKELQILKEENNCLKSLTSSLKSTIEDLEQRSRNKNLELTGIPEENNENLFSLLNEVGKTIGCPIIASDIDTVHRVGHLNANSTRPKNIIVAFTSRAKKEAILNKARLKQKQGIMTTDIGFMNPPSRIYINDHLSPVNKLLLRDAKIKAKETNYKYVWVRHYKVFVRKNETAPIIVINTKSDLNKLN